MMAAVPKALVEEKVLKWLREAAGLSVAETARRIQTKPEKVDAWEAGSDQPSMSKLRDLARVFKRPISDFFLPKPMPEPMVPRDFRRLPDSGPSLYSPALRHELRLAHRRRLLALEIAQDLEIRVPTFNGLGTARIGDDPEAVGGTIRNLLNVTIEDQSKWRDERVAYNAWRQKIEAASVLVFQIATVEKHEMLGFSLVFDRFPVIAVNRKLAPNGRTFTILHEFAHLLIGEGGVCDLEDDVLRPAREQQVEVFCNQVAGAALVPLRALLAHRFVSGIDGAQEWPDDTILALAREFSVSQMVIVRRLLIAQLATQEFYGRKHAQYLAWQARDETAKRDKAAEGFARNMPREAVSNLGRFARLVMDGYAADNINLADASKYLGVKAEKVAAVGELVR